MIVTSAAQREKSYWFIWFFSFFDDFVAFCFDLIRSSVYLLSYYNTLISYPPAEEKLEVVLVALTPGP